MMTTKILLIARLICVRSLCQLGMVHVVVVLTLLHVSVTIAAAAAAVGRYGPLDVIPVHGRGNNPAQEREGPQPYFDPSVTRNITAIASQSAFLNCKVIDLGAKAVSWIRQRDLHILTAGLFTYTSDQRFSIVQRPSLLSSYGFAHHPGTGEASVVFPAQEDWILQIKYVQPRDAGTYECQVSTEPRITMDFHLTVIEAKARILGPAEVHVKQGSSFTLVCQVKEVTHSEGAALFWYHDNQVIDESWARDITLSLHHDSTSINAGQSNSAYLASDDGSLSVNANNMGLIGRLAINRALPHHSGNYTCLPTAAAPAFVIVHVINGEHPAAMQHGNSGRDLQSSALCVVVTILVTVISSTVLTSKFAGHPRTSAAADKDLVPHPVVVSSWSSSLVTPTHTANAMHTSWPPNDHISR